MSFSLLYKHLFKGSPGPFEFIRPSNKMEGVSQIHKYLGNRVLTMRFLDNGKEIGGQQANNFQCIVNVKSRWERFGQVMKPYQLASLNNTASFSMQKVYYAINIMLCKCECEIKNVLFIASQLTQKLHVDRIKMANIILIRSYATNITGVCKGGRSHNIVRRELYIWVTDNVHSTQTSRNATNLRNLRNHELIFPILYRHYFISIVIIVIWTIHLFIPVIFHLL